MRSSIPDYQMVVPNNLDSALALLANGEGWRPIAGGTDIMVLLNAGKLPFQRMVSLRKLDELRQIRVAEECVSVGAAVTYAQVQQHAVLQSEFPLLCQAASWTGGIANQNQGTLGGNIANASPAADSAPPLLIHDAGIRLLSTTGTRTIPYSDFHIGYKTSAMRPDELLCKVELPRRKPGWHYGGRKVGTRRAQAISKVSFAAGACLEGNQISGIRLAFASVAPVPLRCTKTEEMLLNQILSKDVIANAGKKLRAEISPISDIRSTAAYRSQVAQNLLSAFLESLR